MAIGISRRVTLVLSTGLALLAPCFFAVSLAQQPSRPRTRGSNDIEEVKRRPPRWTYSAVATSGLPEG